MTSEAEIIKPGELITFDGMLGVPRGLCLVLAVTNVRPMKEFPEHWCADVTVLTQNMGVMTRNLTEPFVDVYWRRIPNTTWRPDLRKEGDEGLGE